MDNKLSRDGKGVRKGHRKVLKKTMAYNFTSELACYATVLLITILQLILQYYSFYNFYEMKIIQGSPFSLAPWRMNYSFESRLKHFSNF